MNKYPIRLIARLDIKGDKVVKGINLERSKWEIRSY